jgi:hypothetical protein
MLFSLNIFDPAMMAHLSALLGISSCLAVAVGGLKFRDDGTFRIIQFTDLHYGKAAFVTVC